MANLSQLQSDIATLKMEVEKLKDHNLTLLTWVANAISPNDMSIFEAQILLDLSKQELKQITSLFRRYSGDFAKLQAEALTINTSLTLSGIKTIAQGWVVSGSGQLTEKSRQILQDFAKNTNINENNL